MYRDPSSWRTASHSSGLSTSRQRTNAAKYCAKIKHVLFRPQCTVSLYSVSFRCAVFGKMVATHRIDAAMSARSALQASAPVVAVRRRDAENGVALLLALLGVLSAPISSRKAQFAQQVIWCGWKFCFATESVIFSSRFPASRAAALASHRTEGASQSLEPALGLLN